MCAAVGWGDVRSHVLASGLPCATMRLSTARTRGLVRDAHDYLMDVAQYTEEAHSDAHDVRGLNAAYAVRGAALW